MKKRWAILRWACTAGFVLTLTVDVLSAWTCAWVAWGSYGPLIGYGNGALIASWTSAPLRGTLDMHVRAQEHPRVRWFRRDVPLPRNTGFTHAYCIPLWCPALLLAVPAVFLWRFHFRSRRETNPCPTCAYSLTGLAPGSPCPECGKRGEAKP